ncbi:UNKNOWN [Stylonychia lemnae]|uniref:Methyltransferase domain-containing protein n=1 Tax=Stylonychia lemnae TaxID=5949 RepID=A0A078AQX1_STYLE|nr:UNKNOWN [Stylonychia lemnae]|eukprot:CDW84341.1 UNKNOWN [Stylonychia lemnae]
MIKKEDLEIIYAYFSKMARKSAKFLLKCMLFSLIVILEIFLQSSMLFVLLGLCFWVLILIIFTSPLWIPLAILWAPAAIINVLVFRYTEVELNTLKSIYMYQVGEKVFIGVEKTFYYMTYKTTLCRKIIWKSIYNLFSCHWYGIFQSQMCYVLGIKNLEGLSGRKILDLGSGRGGGLAFLTKYYEPEEAFGVDFSQYNTKFSLKKHQNLDNLFFHQGDAEKLHKLKFLKNEQFDITLCIESFHCFANPLAVLKQVNRLLDRENGSFVIADIFEKKDIERTETLFKEFFEIEKKEVITINVKHSINLDKPRAERLLQMISENKYVRKIMANFLGLAEESKTFQELGKSNEYICYVLKPLQHTQNQPLQDQSQCCFIRSCIGSGRQQLNRDSGDVHTQQSC